MPDTSHSSAHWRQTVHAADPATPVLTALRIDHPAIAAPVRAVNDTIDHVIDGHTYVALRFNARLADDVDGQAPQAELSMDNVGAALTQWVEVSGGGVGATVEVMQVAAGRVQWAVQLDVVGMTVTSEQVTARLGFDPMLSRPAVQLRHDPHLSPGLF